MADGWRQADVGGIALAYREVGAGETVVLVHAGVVADFFAPLLDEPVLTARYRMLSYHRVNYGRSSRLAGPVSVRHQAGHCAMVLRRLRIGRAHLVGHSAGGAIALQLTVDAPGLVHSLTLLDPALSIAWGGRSAGEPVQPTAGSPSGLPPFMARAFEQYAAGAKADAVDTFMSAVCGAGYRTKLEAMLPGALEQAVADADGLFQQEIPALLAWSVSPEQLARIEQPVLAVVGAESPPVFAERQRSLLEQLPHAEAHTLPGAGHLLQVEQPRALARSLAAFVARHPLDETGGGPARP
jgi:pimeloyl-ACP methyl ester carboxylesterase